MTITVRNPEIKDKLPYHVSLAIACDGEGGQAKR
jgi:hypothetical protein